MGSFDLGLITPPTHTHIALWAAYISSQAPLRGGIDPKHMVIRHPYIEEPLPYVWGHLVGIWACFGLFRPVFGPF